MSFNRDCKGRAFCSFEIRKKIANSANPLRCSQCGCGALFQTFLQFLFAYKFLICNILFVVMHCR